MELDCGGDVRQRFLSGLALANDDFAESDGIGNEAIGVLLNDDLQIHEVLSSAPKP